MSKIRFVQTCIACPEQYDAFVGKEQVGYLRLRHGHFTVECPDCGGELVCTYWPDGDGAFTDDEREHYLACARSAIETWLSNSKETV